MSQTLIRGSQIQPGTVAWSAMVAGAIVPTTSLIDGALFLKSDGSVSMGHALNLNSFLINNVATPVAAGDAANKSYVDSLANGLTFKAPSRVVALANSALTGLLVIDGVTLVDSDRVLLTAQTTASQNGIWLAHSGAWTRPLDYAAGSTQKEGMYIIVDEGTLGASTKYICTTISAGELITVDTTATSWVQDTSGNQITGGHGLTKIGNQLQALIGNGVDLNGTTGAIEITPDPAGLLSVSGSGVALASLGTTGQIIVAGASGVPAWKSASGDVTLVASGAMTVNNTSGSGFLKYANLVTNETPTGTVDGTNTTFTLANTPYQLHLYLNGVLQDAGSGNDYTLSGAIVTMLFTPQVGDKIRAYYCK